MSDPNATAGDWALSMAVFAVDALVNSGLVPKDQFDVAKKVVAEEIYVHLCMQDYPPPVDLATNDADIARLITRGRG